MLIPGFWRYLFHFIDLSAQKCNKPISFYLSHCVLCLLMFSMEKMQNKKDVSRLITLIFLVLSDKCTDRSINDGLKEIQLKKLHVEVFICHF